MNRLQSHESHATDYKIRESLMCRMNHMRLTHASVKHREQTQATPKIARAFLASILAVC